MRLVIAEKPSVAKSLAAVLGAATRKDGYLEGGGWLVSLVAWGTWPGWRTPPPTTPDYAKWRYDDLPILPESWRFTIAKDKRESVRCAAHPAAAGGRDRGSQRLRRRARGRADFPHGLLPGGLPEAH